MTDGRKTNNRRSEHLWSDSTQYCPGFIPVGDLARVLTTLGDVLSEEETQELLTKADLDGDGNLNYDEFITLLFKVVTLKQT